MNSDVKNAVRNSRYSSALFKRRRKFPVLNVEAVMWVAFFLSLDSSPVRPIKGPQPGRVVPVVPARDVILVTHRRQI